ncbi:MAG: MFS transporter [Chloroflexi bacterium]|nr:MFS transporter [Chloroflexota bacterium]
MTKNKFMQKQKTGSSSWKRILTIFTFASLVETIFYSQLIAFTPLYLGVLGVKTPAEVAVLVGWFTAVANGIGIPFLPFWGALADRYARKPMIVRTFLILLLSGILGLATRSLWVFFLARAITSFALGNSGIMLTTLSERVPENRIGLAFSIMNSAAPLGAFLGPLIGGPIVDTYGLPTMLAVDSLVLIVVVLALVYGYHDEYEGRDQGPLLRMTIAALETVWRSLRLRTLFPALFLLFGGWMLAFTYLPLAVTELYSGAEPNTAIGLVLGAGGLTTLILGPLMGALADRYGYWRMLFIGSGIALVLWPLPALMTTLFTFGVAWAVLNGVVSGIFALSFTVMSSSAATEVRGRVLALAYLPVNVGFMLGPALGTFLIERYGVFAVFPAATVFTALGILVLAISHRQSI